MSRRNRKELKLPLQQPEEPVLSHPLNWNLILGFLLFVVTLFAYHPAWNGQPIWDDDGHITKPELRSIDGLGRIWTHLGATQQYYPVVHSVFWLEYRFWGDSPLGYHLLNILLHIFSALLLVKILRFLQVPGAWLVGAIFALHPVQVESVAWITELKNTLSGVFFLAVALAYLKFDRERERKWYIIAIGFFILGLLSKSVIATLPMSLLVIFWWKRGKIGLKQDVVPLLPFFVIGVASGLFTAWVERKFMGAEGSAFDFSIIERGLIAGRAIWFYMSKLFWPVDLIFIYPRWNVSQAVWWQYLFPLATLLLFGILWALRNRSRAPLAVFVYFSATIFPVMGFFNVYPFRFSFVADHFQYLACIAPIALAVAGLNRAFGSVNRFLKSAGTLILLLVLGLLTWKQSGMYADAETLYRTTITKNSDCWMAYSNLGKLLAESGRMDGVMACFQRALKINPNYAEAHYNLGLLLAQLGQTDEAIAHYRKAIEIKPNYVVAHYNLGILLEQLGRTDEAITHYREALEINPHYVESHNNLGLLLAQLGRTDEAISHYKKALEINPEKIIVIQNLADVFVQQGKTTDAITLLTKALALAKSAGDEALVSEISVNLEKLYELNRSFQKSPR